MIIAKGAEANLILEDFSEVFFPSRLDKILVKHRISKEYRAERLDRKLRDYRTSLEANLLSDAKKAGVPTPTVYRVDRVNMRLTMEYVGGKIVKEILEEIDPSSRKELCEKIGKQIARLHDFGIIHGDLTTSNMIRTEEGKIYFIDFGLGEYNSSTEARGTDIHLLHRTLRSTHFRVAKESFQAVLEGYKKELGEIANEITKEFKKLKSGEDMLPRRTEDEPDIRD